MILKVAYVSAGFVFTCLIAFGQNDCGQAPGVVKYSDHFYQAEATYLAQASNTKASANVVVGDLPLGGSYEGSNSKTESHSLTLDQAHQYVQEEHTVKRAELIRECGYRLCKLSFAPTINAGAAISVLESLCTAAPFPNNANSDSVISTTPRRQTIIFDNAPTQSVSFNIVNGNPGPYEMRWRAESGSDASAANLMTGLDLPSTFTLATNGNRRVVAHFRRPPRGQSALINVRFETTRAPVQFATATFELISDRALLLPKPRILPGTLNPNAYITLDTDHGAGAFKDHHVQDFDLTSPIALRGPNMGHPPLNTAALAQYQASFTATDSTSDTATASMLMSARVGGQCGAGASGGAGGVSPIWRTQLELPGISANQSWSVAVATDLRHITNSAGSCSLTLDSETQPVTAVGVWNHIFSVPVGVHLMTFSCGGPNPYNGCYGHAGGVNDHYEDEKYQVNVTATRISKPRSPVTYQKRP